jgi:PAS domain S-box-containing protein
MARWIELCIALVLTMTTMYLALKSRDDALTSARKQLEERRRAEEKLIRSEERFSKAFHASPAPTIISTVREGQSLAVNDQWCRMMGYSREEMIGRTGKELSIWPYPEERKMLMDRYSNQGFCRDELIHLRTKSGEIKDVLCSADIIKYKDEDVILALFFDVTERKKTDDALRRSEEKYRFLTEKMNDMIWTLDLNLKTTFVTPSVKNVLGYTPEERMQQEPCDQMTPASYERVIELLAGELQRDHEPGIDPDRTITIEIEYYHKNGSVVWLENNISAIRDEKRSLIGLYGVSRDITKRKKVEESLKESEERYRLIFENVTDVVYSLDHELKVTSVSPYVEKIIGYKPEELIGRQIHELNVLDPVSMQRAVSDIAQVIEGRRVLSSEYTFIAKDGIRKSGEVNASPLLRDGEVIAVIAAARDVTERRRLEVERKSLQERLLRAEKMEALGTLAGGVAHDLNNVLGVLVGYSELLLMETPEGHPLRRHTSNILRGGRRAAAIIQDLLTLARRGVATSEPVNLNQLVSLFLESPEFELIKTHHPGLTVKVDLDTHLLNIMGSPVHLEKTLMNLVSNAAEAVSGLGEVTIRTENRYIDKSIPGYENTMKGEYSVLTVSDTGTGIPSTELNRIFEPFYTKKVMGRSGTGLGLAVVWGTVKDHKGYIDVQSEEGKGTIFTLFFPATRAQLVEDNKVITEDVYRGRGEKILVVDDVRDQRELAFDMLTRLGYEAHTVASGEEALEYIRTHSADLVILDMIMDPGIDGLETYKRILEVQPGMRAIIVSGFSETNRVKETLKKGAGAYIRKPYIFEEIGLAVRRELDKP